MGRSRKARRKGDTINKMYVFQVKALKDTNKINLKVSGYVEQGDDFDDEKIDVVKDIMNGDEKSIEIIEYVTVKFNKPNITDAFIVSNKKLPVLYASVVYNKPMVMGVLFNITIFFEITGDTMTIKSIDQLLSMEIEGKFTVEILLDEKKEVIPMDKFSGYPETIKNIISLLKTESMIEIVKSQLKKRDEERIARLGSIANFKPPVPKYNLSELADKYEFGDDINIDC
jgi:hypothetical protein